MAGPDLAQAALAVVAGLILVRAGRLPRARGRHLPRPDDLLSGAGDRRRP